MYPTTKRATVDSTVAQSLYRSVAELEAYGVTVPAKIRKALDTSKVTLARIADMRSTTDPASASRLITEKLARGEGDAAEVLAAASANTLVANNPNSPFRRIFSNAEATVGKSLRDLMAEHGDAWITETLRPHVETHVQTILDAIPETLEVRGNADARQMEFLFHIPAVANAWAHLQGIYTAARNFRRVEVIPSTFGPDDCYEYAGTSNVRDYLSAGDITTFCWAHQHGLTPGLYTEQEVSK